MLMDLLGITNTWEERRKANAKEVSVNRVPSSQLPTLFWGLANKHKYLKWRRQIQVTGGQT